MGNIDWDNMLGGAFVKIESGKPKSLRISNWRPQTQFKDDKGDIRPGLELDVSMEDGKELAEEDVKSWTVTSKRALAKLKPIIEKAEASGKEKVEVTVIRVGEKKDTQYDITEK